MEKSETKTIYYSILYHGNCIDGWFSAYLAYTYLAKQGDVNIQMFPIGPGMAHTYPAIEKVNGTHMWLLDVSLPLETRNAFIRKGVQTINCIDHHASSIQHWDEKENPIDIESCAALQTFKYFFPEHEVPEWLNIIDRIDRWDNVSESDLCIREILQSIASKTAYKSYEGKSYQASAFQQTYNFIRDFEKLGLDMLVNKVRRDYELKCDQLRKLVKTGSFVKIEAIHLMQWELSDRWLDTTLFIMDTTNVIMDSSLASYIAFKEYPDAQVFINYRIKSYMSILQVTYSARSSSQFKEPFNLITPEDSIFKGHATAAGANVNYSPLSPFILDYSGPM
jgi:hypothetical protein